MHGIGAVRLFICSLFINYINAQIPDLWQEANNNVSFGDFSYARTLDFVYLYIVESGSMSRFDLETNTLVRIPSTTAAYLSEIGDQGVYILETSGEHLYFYGGSSYPTNILWQYEIANGAWNQISGFGYPPEPTQSTRTCIIRYNKQKLLFFMPAFAGMTISNNTWNHFGTFSDNLPNCYNSQGSRSWIDSLGSVMYYLVYCYTEDEVYFQKYDFGSLTVTNLTAPTDLTIQFDGALGSVGTGFIFIKTLETITNNTNNITQIQTKTLVYSTANDTWTTMWNPIQSSESYLMSFVGISSSVLIWDSIHSDIPRLLWMFSGQSTESFLVFQLDYGTSNAVWFDLNPSPPASARTDSAIFAPNILNPIVYVFGGITPQSEVLGDFLTYDVSGGWRDITNETEGVPPAVAFHAYTRYGNTFFIWGGYDANLEVPTILYSYYSPDSAWSIVNTSGVDPAQAVSDEDIFYQFKFSSQKDGLLLFITCQTMCNYSTIQMFFLNITSGYVWSNITDLVVGNTPQGSYFDYSIATADDFSVYIFGGKEIVTDKYEVYQRNLLVFTLDAMQWEIIYPSLDSSVSLPYLTDAMMIPWEDSLLVYGGVAPQPELVTLVYVFNLTTSMCYAYEPPNGPDFDTFSNVIKISIGAIFQQTNAILHLNQIANDRIVTKPILLSVCPVGTQLSGNSCVPCTEGQYKNGSMQFCAPCGAGHFSNKYGAGSCDITCPAGSWSSLTGDTDTSSCSQCPAGTYMTKYPSTSIMDCHLCEIGTFNNYTGEMSCEECGASDNITCGVGTIAPSGTFNPTITSLPNLPQTVKFPLTEVPILFFSTAICFVFLFIFVVVPIPKLEVIQNPMRALFKKFDPFPFYPNVVNRKKWKIKHFSSFGGVVGSSVLLFLIGWCIMSVVNYFYYNSSRSISMLPEVNSTFLLSTVTVEVYAYGLSTNCSCDPDVATISLGTMATPGKTCTITDGRTCKISTKFNVGQVAASTLSVNFFEFTTYTQGWAWSVTVSNDADLAIIPQTTGREIANISSYVFSGEESTTDTIFLTPTEFSSTFKPSTNWRGFTLYTTLSPQLGSLANATTVFESTQGTSFSLTFVLNGYTKFILEQKTHTLTDLIVTITSVFGVITIASQSKLITENIYRKIRDKRKRDGKMINAVDDESSMNSTIPLLHHEIDDVHNE